MLFIKDVRPFWERGMSSKRDLVRLQDVGGPFFFFSFSMRGFTKG